MSGISGGDAAAFDPANNTFFEASRFQPDGPVLGIVDGATGELTQTLPTSYNDHSVAVDPVSGEVFVAFGASVAGNPDPVCPGGCIAVYAVRVPEPAAITSLALALAVLAGCTRWLRRSQPG